MKSLYALMLTVAIHATTLPALATDLSAVVAWSQRVELGTLVSGVVAEVHARPGQTVGEGDPLLSLDAREFRSQVAKHQAAHRHAQVLLEEAQREDERAIELYDRTVLSDFERNQALIALEAARARAEAARTDLAKARLALERSVIRAPFAGVVLAVDAAPGQSVVSELQSAPLITVADNRHYRLTADVDAEQAARLSIGTALRATLRGQPMDATVSHIGYEPLAQSAEGPRYALVAEIQVVDQTPLRVGEIVTLHLD